jgi:hypothetical protein
MEFNGDTPRELDYLEKLLTEYQNGGITGKLRRAKRRLTRKSKGQTKTEIADFLNHSNDDYAHQFLNKLIEDDILVQVGEKETASKPVPLYKLDKSRLRTEFMQTQLFQETAPVITQVLEKEGKLFTYTDSVNPD